MTPKSHCEFWDCGVEIRWDRYLCSIHYDMKKAGTIDTCGGCRKWKLEIYDYCLKCMHEMAVVRSFSDHNAIQRDDRKFQGDSNVDRFFVYILLMNNEEYYVGQTGNLFNRIHQHRNNQSQSTRGKDPKLQWFCTTATRDEATELEQYLKHLNSNPIGKRIIGQRINTFQKRINTFQKLFNLLDYTPHQPYQNDVAEADDLPF